MNLEASRSLLQEIRRVSSIEERLAILNQHPLVKSFLKSSSTLNNLIKSCPSEIDFAIKSLLAIGQGPHIFQGLDSLLDKEKKLKELLKTLTDLERFYASLGGIIGYHVTVLELMAGVLQPHSPSKNIRYIKPLGIDISHDTLEVRRFVRYGLEALPHIAEIYPIGGAGDRLNLQERETGEFLPAARLPFCGRSLLGGLVRDLQAKEYLYYKLYGKQLVTPMTFMTSHTKGNHHHIISLCKTSQWFGRPEKSIKFIIQPLVPVISIKGDWVLQSTLQLLLRPGGHGVIWKLALECGIWEWLKQQQYTKALLRQISNPLAGTDYGLLAFTGIGDHYNKEFGFASCPRELNTSEGMDVLIEKKLAEGFQYCISNIEYTEFVAKGVQDVPENPGCPYSTFPANTNILFIDIEKLQPTIRTTPFPGQLVNLKNHISEVNAEGELEEIAIGRLETTMQNLADSIVDTYPTQLEHMQLDHFRSYITYNCRSKTTASTKTKYLAGQSSKGTAIDCFYELLQNQYDLLTNYCQIAVPSLNHDNGYIEKGPSFLFLHHPALGPLYRLIAQKIRGGTFAWGAELQLEIAEVDIRQLNLDGSLLIEAQDVMGSRDPHGIITYNEYGGKCTLHHVVVRNRGINRSSQTCYWNNQIVRHEAMRIILDGNAEFFAENVIFIGEYNIKVPNGHRMIAYTKPGLGEKGEIHFQLERLENASWYWTFAFDKDDHIVLTSFKHKPL